MKFTLQVISEVEADDIHEAVEKVSSDPMEYVLFNKEQEPATSNGCHCIDCKCKDQNKNPGGPHE